jgi:hypothetical protein
MSTVISTEATLGEKAFSNGRLTAALESKLKNPVSSPEFDLLANTNDVLGDVGLTAADSGGRLSFYGRDPIISSPHRFGAMAAIGLAAKSVAAAALWRARTGEGQDIHVDVRKALRRFCGFFDGKWETMNGRAPAMGGFADNPFLELPLFRKTRDGRYVIALDFYPRSKTDTLKFLRCTDSLGAIENAILQWRAEELEAAAAEEGLVLAMVRTTEEFLNEPQYTEVLSTMPLITVEKICESEPMPFKRDGKNPLDGIRAFGLREGRSAGISPCTARMSLTSGGLTPPRSRPSPGMCRLGCAPPSWIAPRKIALGSTTC